MRSILFLVLLNLAAIQNVKAIKCYVCQNCTIPDEQHFKECESDDHDQCKVEVVGKMVNRMCHEDMRQGLGCKDKTEQCYCDANKCNGNDELKEKFCAKEEKFGEKFDKNFPMICNPTKHKANNETSSSGSALIIGGVVGGIALVAVIIGVAVFLMKRN